MIDSVNNQKLAADPNISVWVSASAGTGKTTVLVKRLLRLFLLGINTNKILCLTYTNAGAINMQNRIYEKTKQWAIISDKDLKNEILDLYDNEERKNLESNPKKLNDITLKARNIFLQLVDSPTPLKIYTIHAFCQSVLKKFPIEAGIVHNFKIIDDIEKEKLLQESRQILIASMDKNIDKQIVNNFEYLMKSFSESTFEKFIDNIVTNREFFFDLVEKYKNTQNIKEELKNILFKDLCFKYTNNINLFLSTIISKINYNFINQYKEILDTNISPSKKQLSNNLKIWLLLNDEDKINQFHLYTSLFLKIDKKVKAESTLLSKNDSKRYPELKDFLLTEAQKIENVYTFIDTIKIYNTSIAILDIGIIFNKIYNDLKLKKSVMDFTDLITNVKHLFRKPNICEWILYKLDGGISHILVDEAQDTSPEQWDIIDVLTDEFFSVGGTNKEFKSFFSVGDKKQSIFSFQGTNIKLFEKYENVFKNKILKNQSPFYNLKLNKSFRSCKNILSVIDIVANKLTGTLIKNSKIEHNPNRDDYDGYIELLPLIKKEKENTNSFTLLVNEIQNKINEKIIMAKIIAVKIKSILDNEYIADKKGYKKKITPKDIMILVRKRDPIDKIISALTEQGIPVADKDKISISEHIVIEDLISLLKFTLFNYDDLALSEILKSPLYNLDDNDLFNICYDRKDNLLLQLSKIDKYKYIYNELLEIIEFSKTALPFEFFNYVLKIKDKQKYFIKRFGINIKDILNSFLSQCMIYNNTQTNKSLIDFYDWFTKGEIILSRNMEQINNSVRIMTIHGSKGLEAPIVFLYDTNNKFRDHYELILWYNKIPIYKLGGFKNISDNTAKIEEATIKANKEEDDRLFYVAITRAKDKLYLIGTENNKETRDTWYYYIQDAIENNLQGRKIIDKTLLQFKDYFVNSDVQSLILGSTEVDGEIIEERNNITYSNAVPKFLLYKQLDKNKEVNNLLNKTISPLTDKDQNKLFFEKGTLIHKLLEYITKTDIPNIETLIDNYFNKHNLMSFENLKQNILNLYNHKNTNFIFSKNSLNEVEIINKNNDQNQLLRIDKLIFENNEIWIIDYKTDRIVPKEIPDNYQKQLLQYKKVISKIYPGKTIHTAILWLENLRFQEMI